MSLKAFHIVFISVSAILAFGFGAWILIADATASAVADSGLGATVNILGAFLSFIVGVSLVLYGVRFLRKFQHIRFF